MGTFNAVPFGAALPTGFTLVEQTLSAEQSSQYGFISQEALSGGLGIRKTRQQWEKLKPLIQEIYIEENKPFLYLAKILRDKHGFEPT